MRAASRSFSLRRQRFTIRRRPKTPDTALLVAPDSPIHSAADLVGKTIGTASLNDQPVLATDAWLDSQHIDWHAVQYVEISLPTMTAALEQGRVPAVIHFKPFLTEAVDSGKARILALVNSSISDRFLESGWFANANYVNAHRETVARFARVVAEASAYANAHHAETVDAYRDLQPLINAAAKYNFIPKSFDANEIIAGF